MEYVEHIWRDGSKSLAYQNENGAWIAKGVDVSRARYVGGNAEVRGGTIEGGTIEDGTIWGGTIRSGTIYGGTIWCGTIEDGTIWGGTIQGGKVTRDVTFVCGCIPYQVTITDDFVGVGCEWHSPEVWKRDGLSIMQRYGQSDSNAEKWMKLLVTFIDLHGCKSEDA